MVELDDYRLVYTHAALHLHRQSRTLDSAPSITSCHLARFSRFWRVSRILAFSLFSRHISRTQSFRDNPLFITSYFVVLNPLVLLISRLVTCSARLDSDTHTHTHTERERERERQTNYHNASLYYAPPWVNKH